MAQAWLRRRPCLGPKRSGTTTEPRPRSGPACKGMPVIKRSAADVWTAGGSPSRSRRPVRPASAGCAGPPPQPARGRLPAPSRLSAAPPGQLEPWVSRLRVQGVRFGAWGWACLVVGALIRASHTAATRRLCLAIAGAVCCGLTRSGPMAASQVSDWPALRRGGWGDATRGGGPQPDWPLCTWRTRQDELAGSQPVAEVPCPPSFPPSLPSHAPATACSAFAALACCCML